MSLQLRQTPSAIIFFLFSFSQPSFSLYCEVMQRSEFREPAQRKCVPEWLVQEQMDALQTVSQTFLDKPFTTSVKVEPMPVEKEKDALGDTQPHNYYVRIRLSSALLIQSRRQRIHTLHHEAGHAFFYKPTENEKWALKAYYDTEKLAKKEIKKKLKNPSVWRKIVRAITSNDSAIRRARETIKNSDERIKLLTRKNKKYLMRVLDTGYDYGRCLRVHDEFIAELVALFLEAKEHSGSFGLRRRRSEGTVYPNECEQYIYASEFYEDWQDGLEPFVHEYFRRYLQAKFDGTFAQEMQEATKGWNFSSDTKRRMLFALRREKKNREKKDFDWVVWKLFNKVQELTQWANASDVVDS